MVTRTIFSLALFLLLKTTCTSGFSLVTFDVDGTLVSGSGKAADTSAHSRAFSHAVSQVLNQGKPVQSVADALPRELYHGSTDGLILLRLARATLGLESQESLPHLPAMMNSMYEYICQLEDEQVADGIKTLPGVVDTLEALADRQADVWCGLVTGNVEGVARRKMRAVGVWQTKALASPSPQQSEWKGSHDIGFLGGFGSDYCSGNIDDLNRNYLDRSEQISICVERCRRMLSKGKQLQRVVHVGDAPADVLAAKAYAERQPGVCVGMVATATGSYSAQELRKLAGEPKPGKWECVVLEDGIADPGFVQALGV